MATTGSLASADATDLRPMFSALIPPRRSAYAELAACSDIPIW
jgi:hypothetical protein